MDGMHARARDIINTVRQAEHQNAGTYLHEMASEADVRAHSALQVDLVADLPLP